MHDSNHYYQLDKTRTFLVSQKALIVQDNRLLVLKNMIRPAQWELPGGLLEMDEDLETGLKREIREETSLEIAVGKLVAFWDHWETGFHFRDGSVLDVRLIGVAFCCSRIGGDIVLSHEHSAFKWATREELANLDLSRNSDVAIQLFMNST